MLAFPIHERFPAIVHLQVPSMTNKKFKEECNMRILLERDREKFKIRTFVKGIVRNLTQHEKYNEKIQKVHIKIQHFITI